MNAVTTITILDENRLTCYVELIYGRHSRRYYVNRAERLLDIVHGAKFYTID